MIRDVLNKLKWHPEYDFSRVRLVYISRPEGEAELSGNDIHEIGSKFIILTDGTHIPLHRILEIYHDDKILWRKGEKTI